MKRFELTYQITVQSKHFDKWSQSARGGLTTRAVSFPFNGVVAVVMNCGSIDVEVQWTGPNFLSFVRKKLKLKARSLHVGAETEREWLLVSWDQTPLLPFTRNIQARGLGGAGKDWLISAEPLVCRLHACNWPGIDLCFILQLTLAALLRRLSDKSTSYVVCQIRALPSF